MLFHTVLPLSYERHSVSLALALPGSGHPGHPRYVPRYGADMVGCAGRYIGKTVIVTGGSKGIGEGCARVFFKVWQL